jgi:hypothetical protein
MSEPERRAIGKTFLQAWVKEAEIEKQRQSALSKIAALGLESDSSIRRFNASKAPT